MKKLIILFLFPLLLNAQGWVGNLNTLPSFTPSAYEFDSSTLSLFSRFDTALTITEQRYIDRWIKDMKTVNVWEQFDDFKLYALNTEANSLLNWKSDSINSTNVGSADFYPYTGYGTNVGKYINTNFNPSEANGNYGLDTSAFGLFVFTDSVISKFEYGAQRTTGDLYQTSLISTSGTSANIYVNNIFTGNIAQDITHGFYNGSQRNDTLRFFKNGKVNGITSSGATTFIPYDNFYMGTYNRNGAPFSGSPKIFSLSFDGGYINELQTKVIYNGLMGWFESHDTVPFIRTDSINILTVGNSLTSGVSDDVGASPYPLQLQDSLIGFKLYKDTVYNFGIPTYTTEQIIDSESGHVLKWSSFSKKQLLIFWEITNDIYFGVSTDSSILLCEQYCKRMQQRGFDVAVITAIPAGRNFNGSGTIEAYNDSLDLANTKLISQYTNFSDYLIDLRSVTELQDYNNTTYFSTDKTHLKELGYSIVAREIKSQLQTYFEP